MGGSEREWERGGKEGRKGRNKRSILQGKGGTRRGSDQNRKKEDSNPAQEEAIISGDR